MSRSRFDYVKYDAESIRVQETIKEKMIELEELGELLLGNGRWKSLFLTHIEIAYMAAGKDIRDKQIDRDARTTVDESRGAR